jgi:putative salt-induced outer membrane protein YdiY
MLIISLGLAAALAAASPSDIAPTVAVPAKMSSTTLESAFAQDAASEPEAPAWTGSLTAGLSTTSGNSDIDRASVTADAEKKTDDHRWSAGLSWAYQGSEAGGITQRRTEGNLQYDKFFSDSMFGYANTGVMNDLSAALDLRTKLGVGIGKDLVTSESWQVKGELGLSYLDSEFTDSTSSEFLAARISYTAHYTPKGIFTLEHTGELLPSIEDSGAVATWDTRLKANISETFFAQLQWVFDYNKKPPLGNKTGDHLLLLTVGWTF